MSAPETKRCRGYKGHWACADDYPDHMVPVDEFGPHSGSQDGFQDKCRMCHRHLDSIRNPKNNPLRKIRYELAGGKAVYDELPKGGVERKAIQDMAREIAFGDQESLSQSSITAAIKEPIGSGRGDTSPLTEHSDTVPFPATDPEPVFSNSKKKIKTTTEKRERDQKVVRWVQKRYSACSIDGCGFNSNYFHVAHVHALRNDDADDLPNNCLALCPNHHWQLDNQELRLVDYEDRTPDDPIFVLWWDGKEGIINLADGHTVENSNIEKGMQSLDDYFAHKRGDQS